MTARLEAARAAVHTTVRMYAPAHQNFSEEATRQLNKAIAELEAAAVEANKPATPVPPVDVPPAPPAVALNMPASSEAVGEPTAPDPVKLPAPEVETAPKPKKKGK